MGYHVAHEWATAAGGDYTEEIRSWALAYFHTMQSRMDEFNGVDRPDDGRALYDFFATNAEHVRMRSFVPALLAASSWYDVLAVHLYDNASGTEDVLDALSGTGRPLWITELGFYDNLDGNGTGAVPMTDDLHRRQLSRHVARALSHGVDHVAYSGLFGFTVMGTTAYGLYQGLPASALPPQATYQLTTWALEGASADLVTHAAGAEVHRFAQPGGGAAVAWRDAGAGSIDLLVAAGVPDGVPVFAFDHEARVVEDPSGVSLGSDAVVLRWGAGLVDADADGYPAGYDCADGDPSRNPGQGSCAVGAPVGCSAVGPEAGVSGLGLVLIGLVLARVRRVAP